MPEHTLSDRASGLTKALERSPVVPTVRDLGENLKEMLSLDYPAIFVLDGDVFELGERLRGKDRRPPVCVKVDLAKGISPDF